MAEVLPQVRAAVPAFELTVVGANPPQALLDGAGGLGIDVVGRVDDVLPHLHRAALSVVPLRAGSGSRLKILESMAAGVPVVSTTRGAEGLAVEAGRHLVVADGAEDMARAVVDLLGDPARRGVLAAEARAGWSRPATAGRRSPARLLDLYEDLSHHRSSPVR